MPPNRIPCTMAPVRCVAHRQHTISRLQAALQPSRSLRVPVRHYWITRPGDAYSRARIYNRDAYYARWIQERDTRQARLCGSWTRRKLRDHAAAAAAANQGKDVHEKATSESIKDGESNKKKTGYMSASEFSRLLGCDAAVAYDFMREIEKDPYRWIFDPYNTKSAWNPADWWKKHHGIPEKSRAQSEESSLAPSSDQKGTTSTSTEPKQSTAESEEYVIDPITLKKVFVQYKIQSATETNMLKSHPQGSVTHDIPIKRRNNVGNSLSEEEIDIPLKKPSNPRASSSPSKSSSMTNSSGPKLSGFANQPWLVKEGFTVVQQPSLEMVVSSKSLEKEAPAKIEPSLERLKGLKRSSKGSLQYPPPEKTTDDVDLLRPEDIRAASGHIKHKNVPSPAEMERRSKTLKSNWQNASGTYSQDLLEVYNDILKKRQSRQLPADLPNDVKKLSSVEFKKVKEHYNELQGELDQTRKVLEQARRQLLHDMLTSEAKTVKESFESFETRPRDQVSTVAELKDSKVRQNDEAVKAVTQENKDKFEKVLKDRALVAEIRKIYEDKYGTITNDHRQPGTGEVKASLQLSSTVSPPKHDNHPTSTSPRSSQGFGKSMKSEENELFRPANMTGTSLRDLLYQNISDMPLSQETQKRLKFALRSVPELDTIVYKLEEAATVKPVTPAIDSTVATKTLPEVAKIREIPTDQLRKKSTSKDEPIFKNGEKDKRNEEPTYLYKILAIDVASGEVAVATTTSSIKHKASIPRSAAGILVHLDQPAKYFSYMEKLDSQGFKLVSGSRNMLVYRRRTDQDGTDNQAALKSSKPDNSMKPLREEAVFSGPREPKERLLRSYQLAHRRARAKGQINTSQDVATPSAGEKMDSPEPAKKESLKQKIRRSLMSRTAAVFLAVLLCYAAGNMTARREMRQYEDGIRKRREEAALRRVEAQKNDWRWF